MSNNHQTYFQHPWLAFKRPQVRDLAYAIASPPVLLNFPSELRHLNVHQAELTSTEFWQTHYENYLPKLQELEKDPTELNCFLAKNYRSLRLGSRFEALLLYWLQDTNYHSYQLIVHNLQLFDNQITLGELDFIVLNTTTNKIEHWEVAVKFFLGEMPFSPAHWKGLKGSDNLLKKTTHLLTKSLSYDAVRVNNKTYCIDKRVAIIKGRFFIPYHQHNEFNRTQIAWLNPQLPFGKWFNHIPNNIIESQWRQGRRVEWLTKRDCYNQFDLTEKNQRRRKPLIWQSGLYFNQLNDATKENAIMLRLTNSA